MKKILVVDDSPTLRALFRAYMPSNGYEMYEAQDHTSALKLAKKIHPDICVLDYNLPDKNGIEIAQEFITADISTKFILMTTDVAPNVLATAKKLGFVAFINKPLNPNTVTSALKSQLL